MRIVRIYADAAGQTHYEESDLPFATGGATERTALQAATGIHFWHIPPDHFLDWHRAPRRMYVITLTGEMEVQVGDGEVRRFGPGDVLLVEDLTGKGHNTRAIGPYRHLAIFVHLAE